jgi:hypothetical protein
MLNGRDFFFERSELIRKRRAFGGNNEAGSPE